KPAMTWPEPTRRTFRAEPLMMVWPRETWPSPAMTTLPALRTVRIVVPCHVSGDGDEDMLQCDIGAGAPFVKRPAALGLTPGLGHLGEKLFQGWEIDAHDPPAKAIQFHDGRDGRRVGLFRVFE